MIKVITLWLALFYCHSNLAEPPEYQHGISLLHDLKYPADFKHFDYVNFSAPKGGVLKMSTTIPNRNFSGAWGLGVTNAAGLERTIDKLLVRSADEQSGLYGLLADGVALSKDGKSLFIRLHKLARWHDSMPVTTTDVRFSYDALMTSASAVYGKAYLDSWIKSVEVINKREFIIHHRKVFTHSNLLALTTFKILPAHYYEDHEDPFEPTLEVPIVNGPYRVAEFDRNYVLYNRVTDYWASELPVNQGRNNFDQIRYEIFSDATVARQGFRKGLFDVYIEDDVRYWHTALQPSQEDEILMSSGKAAGVLLSDGEKIDADIVISNADSGYTYESLLKKSKRKRWTTSKLSKQRWSMGLFVWYFGTRNTRSLWQDVDFHTVVNLSLIHI